VEFDWYVGPHAQLRHLFELAEDSRSQLDSYIDLGRDSPPTPGIRTPSSSTASASWTASGSQRTSSPRT
jgi:hypothetical protein